MQKDDLDSSSVMYQSAELKRNDQGLEYMKFNYVQWVEAIEGCILQQLKAQAPELELLTHATIVPSMHGWERSDNTSLGYAALNNIRLWFRVPLDRTGMDRRVGRC